MEVMLIIFNYLTMLMYFDLFYRLFTPEVKLSTAFISFFLVVVLFAGSINIFIIPLSATSLRIILPHLIIFIWINICFDDSIEYKMFGCLIEIMIGYIFEIFCTFIVFLLTKQRTIFFFDGSSDLTILILRVLSILANLGAYEVVIRYVRKYKIVNIPYSSIIIPMLSLPFFIGNNILTVGYYKFREIMILTTFITLVIIGILLCYMLKVIQAEFKKKKMIALQNELEQQYQMLLNDYLNITDSELLQKYLRHDILNHLLILNEMKQNDRGE